MLRRLAGLSALILLLVPICESRSVLAQATPAAAADAASGLRLELDAWRAQREREISAPDGWLTLIGLEWLKPGINSFGSSAGNSLRIHAQAPDHMGMLTVSGNVVRLLPPAGGFPPGMKVDGNPAREGTINASDEKPTTIAWHNLTLVVLPRGDRYVLRLKDANAPTRASFRGLHWYAPDPHYRVTAHWIPLKPRQVEQIPTVIGTVLNMTAPGVVDFSLGGKDVLLEPVLEGGDASKLFFILRDTTSTTTTYGGGRFLTTGLPNHGLDQPGELTLDFNELYNPPCAYTAYATCPLPPQKNRLPLAIEAGEQRYEH